MPMLRSNFPMAETSTIVLPLNCDSHDGRFATLRAVVDHYDSFLATGLSDDEKNDRRVSEDPLRMKICNAKLRRRNDESPQAIARASSVGLDGLHPAQSDHQRRVEAPGR